MTERGPYPTAAGVESAIKDAAKKAAAADPSLDANKRIQLEYFNRFLSRVFSEDDDSGWVLKGGTGILARVPSTRATEISTCAAKAGLSVKLSPVELACALVTRLTGPALSDDSEGKTWSHNALAWD